MNEIKLENEYRDRVLELNSQQALLIGYVDPTELFRNISALGTVGIIKEIDDVNYKETFALNISKEGFHLAMEPLTAEYNDNTTVDILVCGMTDVFFNNKDFEYIMEDTIRSLVINKFTLLRIIIIKDDGLAIKVDINNNLNNLDMDDEVKTISNIAEISIAKLLKMELASDDVGELYGGKIVYRVIDLGSDYAPDLYYLIDKENIQNTRLIKLGDEDDE